MSCDMNMTAFSNNKEPFPSNPAPASGALASAEASLRVELDVGEVTTSPQTTEHSSPGDGDQVQCLSRHRSISCSSSTDDNLNLEAISDALPSESSPANLTEGHEKSMETILSTLHTNTAAKTGNGLQGKHARTFSTTSSNSPWGADSPWGAYKIPEEFDEQGCMTRWTTATVQKVKPYFPEDCQDQKGGSGILDTGDPTHYYLMMPLGSLESSPGDEVPEEIQQQRRMYTKFNNIEPLGPDDHTGLTDVEDGSGDDDDDDDDDDCSDDNDADTAHTNDPNTGNPVAAVIPAGPTQNGRAYGGLWNIPGTRDVRKSRFSQEIIYTEICMDETGSNFSWTDDDECETDVADAPTHSAPNISLVKYDPVVADAQDHSVLKKSKEKCDPKVEDMPAHNVCHRIVITTTDDGTVRIDLPRVIVVSFPGKPTKELPFSVANLSKTCWDIIKDHGIAAVRVINNEDKGGNSTLTTANSFDPGSGLEDITTSSLPGFDNIWIQNNAIIAMKDEFPTIEYYEAIQAKCDQNRDALAPEHISFLYYNSSDLVTHYILNKPLAPPNSTLKKPMANGYMVPLDESNLTVPQFIKRLYIDYRLRNEQSWTLFASYGPDILFAPPLNPHIDEKATMVDDWPVEERVLVPKTFNHRRGYFDLQQFDWLRNVALCPDRVRSERDSRYVEYRNTDTYVSHNNPILRETYNLAYFVPKAMYTKYKASTPHKQLRNLMAVKSYNAVVYASDRGVDRSKVFHYHPFHDVCECIIDLSETSNETVYAEPVRISTVALSTGDYYRGICMVGGFDGEYALKNMLHNAEDQSVIVGHATRASYGIVNHIDIDYYAHGNEYRAVMACNDNKIRILDVETNTFLSDPGSNTNTAVRSGELSGHYYPFAVNCTAMCPDGKLRVVVGDTTDVHVVNAETGQSERILQGHEDYGFACAWSPDRFYIATANQDRLVKIWDTRTWRVVTQFAGVNAGYRSMRFSPVGGGSKCLLLAEPADRVCVVNATTYETMQTHAFYGEIVGIDFHGDGTGFWVANGDEKFGGMMEYERRGYGQSFGWDFLNKNAVEEAGGAYREHGPNEWCWEMDRRYDPRVVDKARTGAAGNYAEMGLE